MDDYGDDDYSESSNEGNEIDSTNDVNDEVTTTFEGTKDESDELSFSSKEEVVSSSGGSVEANWDYGSYARGMQANIISEHNDNLDNLGFACGNINESLHSYSKENYDNLHNPGHENILGHHNLENGSIHFINENPESAKHTISHEIFHKSSYQRESLVSNKEGSEMVYNSGVLEIRSFYDKEGNYLKNEEVGRGLNEGMTEMYTMDYLKDHGEVEALESYQAYSDEVNAVRELSDLVGKDTIEAAYFAGDKQSLEDAVNMYAKSDTAFSELNQDLDTINSSKNPDEIMLARQNLDALMTKMQANKVEMEALENESN